MNIDIRKVVNSQLKNNEITEDEAMELLEDFEKEVEHNGSSRNNKK